MKLLVVEQNDLVSKIYKKIFQEKNYEADFAKNNSDCLEKIEGNYDYVVVPNHDSQSAFEEEIRRIKPNQKIFSLSSYMDSESPQELKETCDIIEKPFALLAMVAKLESKKVIQNN